MFKYVDVEWNQNTVLFDRAQEYSELELTKEDNLHIIISYYPQIRVWQDNYNKDYVFKIICLNLARWFLWIRLSSYSMSDIIYKLEEH